MGKLERRRTDRLMLTIPLLVKGDDIDGRPFEAKGHTIVLNRHGARIHLNTMLRLGQVIRVTNMVNRRTANFRVVGPTEPYSERGGEYAVEAEAGEPEIWGIYFPPSSEGQQADSRALLECRKCHFVVLLPLSLVEVDVLKTSGILLKSCPQCSCDRPYGLAEKRLAMDGPPTEAAMFVEAVRTMETTEGRERRKHPRHPVQVPVLVRDYYGGVEIGRSENVSQGGFCFASEKNYFMGQGLVVVCPYEAGKQKEEVHARVVRRQDLEGSHRKIYGVRFAPLARKGVQQAT